VLKSKKKKKTLAIFKILYPQQRLSHFLKKYYNHIYVAPEMCLLKHFIFPCDIEICQDTNPFMIRIELQTTLRMIDHYIIFCLLPVHIDICQVYRR
jgi:hypothetical protein